MPRSTRGGTTLRHWGITCGQRGWKAQPGGGSSGLGASPARMMRWRRRSGSGSGNRRDQRLGIGMGRSGVERRGLGRLDDPAEIHDRDAVADMLDHRQIVGDEDIGEAEPRLEVDQQIEDLRLDRDVEGRDRLVGDDQLGLERDGPGDADALALAAGEFMGIAARRIGLEPDDLEQLGDPAPARRPDRRGDGSPAARRCWRRR